MVTRQTRIEVPADEKYVSAGQPGRDRFKIINEMLVKQSLTCTKSLTTTLSLFRYDALKS